MVIRLPSTGSGSVAKLHSQPPASPSGALFIFINFKNFQTIRKLIAYENFLDYSIVFASFEDRFSSWTFVHLCLTCVRVRKGCSVGKTLSAFDNKKKKPVARSEYIPALHLDILDADRSPPADSPQKSRHQVRSGEGDHAGRSDSTSRDHLITMDKNMV